MTNPYTIPHLEVTLSTARARVVALEDSKKFVDASLKAAKLKLKQAEEDLIFARQLRMF